MIYRNKIKDLLAFKDKKFIKVITGVRRCGKSTLLNLYSQELKKDTNNNVVYINFEEFKYQYLTDKELYDLLKSKVRSKTYLLLDEIQRIQKWELVINSLFVEYSDIDIYITGSNAYLLSSELSTYIAGRYIEIKLFPLSYKEFLNFTNKSAGNESFDIYLKYGGMPVLYDNINYDEINQCKNIKNNLIDTIFDGMYSSIIMKDVLEKIKVKDTSTLKKIILFLSNNIGNITSLNNIKNVLKNEMNNDSIHLNTLENYILSLQNAYLFYEVKRYDIKEKDLLKTLNKYYIVDLGLRNYLLNDYNNDRGRILENIVYLELIRRGYRVNVGKFDNTEVDFITIKENKQTYIQVTETVMGEETRKRELKPLKSINDNYEKIVISMDEVFLGNIDNGIQHKNIINWLLE